LPVRYWGNYGRKLFEFSFFEDQGVRTQNSSALALAKSIEDVIPAEIVAEFVWRRQRNFNVSQAALTSFFPSSAVPDMFMCITLDDSSPFGFNIAESLQIKSIVQSRGLSQLVNIHPGADEVGLSMLSRAALFIESRSIRLALLWRLPQEQARIPNYEGQPLNQSVLEQVQASGAILVHYLPSMQCGSDFDAVSTCLFPSTMSFGSSFQFDYQCSFSS
jgi:Protein of unknown function (DUF4127)